MAGESESTRILGVAGLYEDTTRFSVVVAQFRNYYQSKFGFQDTTGFSLVEFSTSQLTGRGLQTISAKHRGSCEIETP